ncbi:MAG TPA: TetR family transcriptional regulator C-terminal domain-containing protein [Steroidobacteraceae bacterium]
MEKFHAKKARPGRKPSGGRASSSRQRLRLINACISALHIHGPSRTTVEKVVAIAGMSPGIVRFYFASKAAMLVASLQFLAAEFEQRVLVPVAQLRNEPVRALATLVDLYLDPDIASPRKVSVWYSFWGEASSRQEYFDICGQKDARFAEMVRELIGNLITQSGATHLDPAGVALGLIGALEMMWQDFAFQTETRIDRTAARRQCMGYLRSVFPQQFGRLPVPVRTAAAAPPVSVPGPLAPGAEAATGREQQWLANSWQIAAPESAIAAPGDFVAAELVSGPVLIVRDEEGVVRAFRNQCGQRPHVLTVVPRGHFSGAIECPIHGFASDLRGRALSDRASEGLITLHSHIQDGLITLRAGRFGEGPPALSLEWGTAQPLAAGFASMDLVVYAPWRMLVEHWLEFELPEQPAGRLAGLLAEPQLHLEESSGRIRWRGRIGSEARGWSARRYATLANQPGSAHWNRLFVPPNEFIERRDDGLSVLQVIPVAADQCRVRWLECRPASETARTTAMHYLAHRLRAAWLAQDTEAVQSAHRARLDAGPRAGNDLPVVIAVAAFRSTLARHLRDARVAGLQSGPS